MNSIKLLLVHIIMMLPLAHCDPVNPKLPTVDTNDLRSESGVRQVIRRIHPKLEASFYYYDGEQSFGVFLDPKEPTNVLLLVVPDGSVLDGKYTENGRPKNLKRKENRVTVVFPDPKTGVPKREPCEDYVGTFIIVPKDGDLHLELRIMHRLGVWSLTASRSRDGRWTGTMHKTDSFSKAKDQGEIPDSRK